MSTNRQPEWVRRAASKTLPASDRTGQIKVQPKAEKGSPKS